MRSRAESRIGMVLDFAWHCGCLALGIYVLAGSTVAWAVVVLAVFVIVGTLVEWADAASTDRCRGTSPTSADGESVAARADEIVRRELGGAPSATNPIERQQQSSRRCRDRGRRGWLR